MPTTTTDNPLWNLQAQYLPGTFQAATDIYNQGAPGYYPGSTVAGLDPLKTQGLNLGVDAALGAQTDLANTYATQLGGIAGGTDAYTQQLANQAAGATNFGFGQAGTLGSARHANAASQAATNTIADRQLSALSQIPQAQTAAATPGQTLSQIGGVTQDYAQSLIDADKQKYDYQANQPYNWLNQYQSALAPGGISAPTTTNQQATGLETATGIASIIGGLFGGGGFFAEGGEVPGYANGGLIGDLEGQLSSHYSGNGTSAPASVPTSSAGPAGVYSPVETQRTTYDGGWQAPQASHAWGIVDGRYQLIPTAGGSQPGGYAEGATPTGYVPQQIGYDAAGNTQVGGQYSSPGAAAAAASASGSGIPGYTTYGGHQDVAHQTIDEAFQ